MALLVVQSHVFVLAEESAGDTQTQTEASFGESGTDIPGGGNGGSGGGGTGGNFNPGDEGGNSGGAFRKCCAMAAIFCLLAYYHTIGKRAGGSALRERYLGQVL